jgi:hypothetical protein
MTRRIDLGAAATLVAVLLSLQVDSLAQGRITSAASETRKIEQALEREVERLAARRADLWFAYRMVVQPSTRQACGGSHVALESSTQIIVMGRIEDGRLGRVRQFTPECDVDAGSVTVVWLEGVSADDSANWLMSLIRVQSPDSGWQSRVADPALNALARHTGNAATRSLIALARDDARPQIRSRALLALGQHAGNQAGSTITGAIEKDPEAAVRKAAVAALGRLPNGEGVPLLIGVARSSTDNEIRREAMLRLGQSNDSRAVRFFEEILTK